MVATWQPFLFQGQNMDRRGFLGAILGGAPGCFITLPATQPEPSLSLPPNLIEAMRVFRRPLKELLNYRLYAVTDKGERFVSAGIRAVERELGFVEFLGQDVPAFCENLFIQGGLISPEGYEYPEYGFDHPRRLIKGDSLRLSYCISMS